MQYLPENTERMMLAAVQVAVDDIARTVATLGTVDGDDPFTQARLAKIISTRVSQTFLVMYAVTRVTRCSPRFLDGLEALRDLAEGLIPQPDELAASVDWDDELARLFGAA